MMGMPISLPFSEFALAIPVLPLLGALVWYARARKTRRWKAILNAPAFETLVHLSKRRKPAWVKPLPTGLKYDVKTPLFEVLYAHFRKGAENTNRPALRLAEAAVTASTKPNETTEKLSTNERVSAEDKLGTLMSTPADYAAPLPADALAQNVVLNLVNVLKGKKKLSLGLEHALWDTLGAGGGFAGAKMGGALGVSLGPLLIASSSFLPAWILVGAWLGSLAGKKVGTRFKARRYFSAIKRLRKTSRDFKRWFLAEFPEFIEEIDRDFERVSGILAEARRKEGRPFFRYWRPNIMTTFCDLARVRLKSDHASERKRFVHLRSQLRSLDPIRFASVLEQLDSKSVRAYPELVDHLENYRAAIHEIEEIRDGEVPPKMAA
jgi:hypothetical protein